MNNNATPNVTVSAGSLPYRRNSVDPLFIRGAFQCSGMNMNTLTLVLSIVNIYLLLFEQIEVKSATRKLAGNTHLPADFAA